MLSEYKPFKAAKKVIEVLKISHGIVWTNKLPILLSFRISLFLHLSLIISFIFLVFTRNLNLWQYSYMHNVWSNYFYGWNISQFLRRRFNEIKVLHALSGGNLFVISFHFISFFFKQNLLISSIMNCIIILLETCPFYRMWLTSLQSDRQ